MKRLLILIAAEALIAAVGRYGLRQAVNRLNQAAERVAGEMHVYNAGHGGCPK